LAISADDLEDAELAEPLSNLSNSDKAMSQNLLYGLHSKTTSISKCQNVKPFLFFSPARDDRSDLVVWYGIY